VGLAADRDDREAINNRKTASFDNGDKNGHFRSLDSIRRLGLGDRFGLQI
jgi:hypothetical protein